MWWTRQAKWGNYWSYHKRPVRLAYQPPASSTFLSQQISHQQPASSTLLSEQTSTSHQLPANRTGWKFQYFSTCLLSVWSVDFGIQFLSIWLGMCSFDYVVWVHFTYLSLAQIHLIYVKGCFSWIVLKLCDHHYVDLCYFGFKCLLWSYSEPFCDSVTITMYIAVSLSFSVPPSHMNLVIFMLHFLIY
jgi:hypothetical protein